MSDATTGKTRDELILDAITAGRDVDQLTFGALTTGATLATRGSLADALNRQNDAVNALQDFVQAQPPDTGSGGGEGGTGP